MRARSKGKSRFHAVRWTAEQWRRIAQATERHRVRSQVRVSYADVIRIAVDAYLAQDEARPTKLAS